MLPALRNHTRTHLGHLRFIAIEKNKHTRIYLLVAGRIVGRQTVIFPTPTAISTACCCANSANAHHLQVIAIAQKRKAVFVPRAFAVVSARTVPARLAIVVGVVPTLAAEAGVFGMVEVVELAVAEGCVAAGVAPTCSWRSVIPVDIAVRLLESHKMKQVPSRLSDASALAPTGQLSPWVKLPIFNAMRLLMPIQ